MEVVLERWSWNERSKQGDVRCGRIQATSSGLSVYKCYVPMLCCRVLIARLASGSLEDRRAKVECACLLCSDQLLKTDRGGATSGTSPSRSSPSGATGEVVQYTAARFLTTDKDRLSVVQYCVEED